MFLWVLFLVVLPSSSTGVSAFRGGRELLVVHSFHLVLDNSQTVYQSTWDWIGSYLFDVDKHVYFILHGRFCPPHTLSVDDSGSITSSCFDRNKKTKILIHGWLSGANNHYSLAMKDAYLKTRDYNIITVDWSWYSYSLYIYSRLSIQFVGSQVGKFVELLIEIGGADPDDVHILGHSLGAHIAGVAGEEAKYNLSRITGMDPAMPLVIGNSAPRLDSGDAKFVDIIHTSIYYLGVYLPTGHADFYPNGGGPFQPGCGLEIGVCTHQRSYRYYIESLYNEKSFMAVQCDSWSDFVRKNCSDTYTYMGEGVSHLARGRMYLYTATEPPYGLGDIAWGNASYGSTKAIENQKYQHSNVYWTSNNVQLFYILEH